MKKFISVTLSVAMLAASVTAASAATVQPVSGKVSHNGGEGFKLVSGSVDAKQGDKVMVAAGGKALIVYENGCRETVGAGRVASVGTAANCKDQSAGSQVLADMGTSHAKLSTPSHAAAAAPISPVVPVLVAVGAGAGIIYLIKSNGPKCASAC
jgi:hypothetical protein